MTKSFNQIVIGSLNEHLELSVNQIRDRISEFDDLEFEKEFFKTTYDMGQNFLLVLEEAVTELKEELEEYQFISKKLKEGI